MMRRTRAPSAKYFLSSNSNRRLGFIFVFASMLTAALTVFSLGIFSHYLVMLHNSERTNNELVAFQMAEAGLDQALYKLKKGTANADVMSAYHPMNSSHIKGGFQYYIKDLGGGEYQILPVGYAPKFAANEAEERSIRAFKKEIASAYVSLGGGTNKPFKYAWYGQGTVEFSGAADNLGSWRGGGEFHSYNSETGTSGESVEVAIWRPQQLYQPDRNGNESTGCKAGGLACKMNRGEVALANDMTAYLKFGSTLDRSVLQLPDGVEGGWVARFDGKVNDTGPAQEAGIATIENIGGVKTLTSFVEEPNPDVYYELIQSTAPLEPAGSADCIVSDGVLVVEADQTCTISGGGAKHLTSVTIKKNGTLVTDAETHFYVDGDTVSQKSIFLGAHASVTPFEGRPQNAVFYLHQPSSSVGKMTLATGAEFIGAVYWPNGRVNVDQSGAVLKGAVVSQMLYVMRGGTFYYDESLKDFSIQIPGSGSSSDSSGGTPQILSWRKASEDDLAAAMSS